MNYDNILLWGFVATVVLTSLLAAGQGLGYSRISMPFLLGTMFTRNRDLAMLIGAGIHMVNGWIFALIYALIFQSVGYTSGWLGALIGIFQTGFVLLVLMPLMPGLHPRMASERQGPTPTRELQPPGFLGLHYGRGTPVVNLIAHVAYGAIIGSFYRLV